MEVQVPLQVPRRCTFFETLPLDVVIDITQLVVRRNHWTFLRGFLERRVSPLLESGGALAQAAQHQLGIDTDVKTWAERMREVKCWVDKT